MFLCARRRECTCVGVDCADMHACVCMHECECECMHVCACTVSAYVFSSEVNRWWCSSGMSIFLWGWGTRVAQRTCGAQRTTCRSGVCFPAMWTPGTEQRRSPGSASPLSHLTGLSHCLRQGLPQARTHQITQSGPHYLPASVSLMGLQVGMNPPGIFTQGPEIRIQGLA